MVVLTPPDHDRIELLLGQQPLEGRIMTGGRSSVLEKKSPSSFAAAGTPVAA